MEEKDSPVIPGASYYIVHKKNQCEFYRCNGFKITTKDKCSVCSISRDMKDKIQQSISCITFHNQEDEIIDTQITSHSPTMDLHALNKPKLDPQAKPKAYFAKIEEGTSPKRRRITFYDEKKRDLIGFNCKVEDDLSFILNSPAILKAVDTSSFQEFVNNL